MKRPRPGIGTELLPVALVHLGLAGTLILVLYTYHRSATIPKPLVDQKDNTQAVAVVVAPEPEPDPEPPPVVVLPPEPPKPVEDPTKPILARLSAEEAKLRAQAAEADRQTKALEAARQVALAESKRWRRREAVVRAQVDELTHKAETIEDEANSVAMERDVLAKQRDNARTDLARAKNIAGGYAVLPHKGVHGTWQRPVMIECRNGQAILQPSGIAFDMMDMSSLAMLRGSPFLGAMARELVKVQQATSPDGEPVVPYIYFIVRPDGIRPYYEARSRLEPLGIAFGYELVEQDWRIEFPDFDELKTWDGFTPLRPKESIGSSVASTTPTGRSESGGDSVWPVDRGGSGTGGQGGAGKPGAGNGFIWPSQRPGSGGPPGFDDPRGLSGNMTGPGPGSASGLGLVEIPGAGGSGIDLGDLRPPLPGREIGRPPAGRGLGSPTGFDRGSTRLPAPNADPGVVSVDPTTLPNLDSPDRPLGNGGAGVSQTPVPNLNSPGRSSGNEGNGVSLTPGQMNPGAVGSDPSNPDSTQDTTKPFRPPPGRVRIDPTLLAYVDEAQELLDRRRGKVDGSGKPDASQNDGSSQGDGQETNNSTKGAGSSSGAAGSGHSQGQPTSAGGGSFDLRPKQGAGAPQAGARPNFPPMRTQVIEVPLPLVVACASDGVTIHPGGYRLTTAALKKPGALVSDLQAIVRNHAIVDPTIHPKPRVEFLIEPGGSDTYVEARKQTVLSGISWPVTFQVSETSAPRVFPKERF